MELIFVSLIYLVLFLLFYKNPIFSDDNTEKLMLKDNKLYYIGITLTPP